MQAALDKVLLLRLLEWSQLRTPLEPALVCKTVGAQSDQVCSEVGEVKGGFRALHKPACAELDPASGEEMERPKGTR